MPSRARLTPVLLSAGVLLSSVSFFLMLPVLPLYLIHLQGSVNVGMAGVVVGSSFLVSSLSSPIWGGLTDRYGSKPMMLRSAIGLTVVYALFPLTHNIGVLLALRLLNGLVAGYVPAAFALISRTTSQNHLGKAMSALSVCRSAGALLGPALGGLLVAWAGYEAAFYGAAVSMAIAGLVILPIRETRPERPSRRANRWRALLPTNLRAGRPALLLTVATVTASSALTLTLPILLRQLDSDADAVAARVGVLLSVAGGLALVLGMGWGALADRVGFNRLLPIVLGASGVLLIVVAVVGSTWGVATGYLLYSAVQCEIPTLLVMYLVAEVPEGQRGSAMGFNNTSQQLGSALGPMLGSAVVALAGVRASFWFSGLLTLACCLIFIALRHKAARPLAATTTGTR